MMNQQKTRKAGILKYSLIVPLALALVLSSNAETLVASAEKALTSTKSTEVVVNSKENNVALVSSESQVSKPVLQKSGNKDIYEKVEKMPEYPGGVNELMNYLTKNIKYTANAKAKGIEGRIIVRFVVNKVGKIEKAEIIRGLDPSCDKEALRVVNAMPQWIPGKLNGKKVSVYYTLPISFKSSIKTTTTIMYDDPKYDKPQKEMIYESLDKMPQFPNGNKELMNYIARNIKYPVEAQKNGVQGKIIVRFIVISNGKVANPVVVRSIENTKRLDEVVVVGYDVKKGTDDKGTEQKQIQPGTDMKLLEKEAIRVINSLPNFIPGEIKGQKVSVFYTLPITFKLE